jgi:hypothetical protein
MLDDLRRVLTLFAGFLIGMHVAVFLHELGHALGHWIGGGRVTVIVMQAPLPAGHVIGTSSDRRWPVWGGVGFGSLIALVPLFAAQLLPNRSRLRFATLMIAAFCLAHNGVYLFVGGLFPFSDASNMIALGNPRWLLFLLGVPLIIAFIAVLSAAIRAVDLCASESIGKWILVTEIGLWSFPALMVTSMLFMPVPSNVRTPTMAFVACYAVCFAIAGCWARSAPRDGDEGVRGMPAKWSTAAMLLAAAACLIGIEWLAFRPA